MRNPILLPTLLLGLLASASNAVPIGITSAGSGPWAVGARDFHRGYIADYFRAEMGGWKGHDFDRLQEGWPWNLGGIWRPARFVRFPGADAPALYRPSILGGIDFSGSVTPVLHRQSIKGGMDYSEAGAPALHRTSIKGGMDFIEADAPALHGPSIKGWIEDFEFGGAHEPWLGTELSYQSLVPRSSPGMPAVPESSALALFALGLAALAGFGLRTRLHS